MLSWELNPAYMENLLRSLFWKFTVKRVPADSGKRISFKKFMKRAIYQESWGFAKNVRTAICLVKSSYTGPCVGTMHVILSNNEWNFEHVQERLAVLQDHVWSHRRFLLKSFIYICTNISQSIASWLKESISYIVTSAGWREKNVKLMKLNQ